VVPPQGTETIAFLRGEKTMSNSLTDCQRRVLAMKCEPFSFAFDAGLTLWHGTIEALDGCGTVAPSILDVADALTAESDTADWDGNSCALLTLADGRLMAWETTWGPTGDGFSADAYGGDATIYVARSRSIIARMGLSDAARAALGIDINGGKVEA
jgi:hypothetical protein